MTNKIKLIEKYIFKLAIVTFLIVIVSTFESLIFAKSKELLDTYITMNPKNTINDYLGVVLLNYFVNILEPILILLYTLFTYKKFGINKIYKIVFSIIISLRFINILLSFRTNSIFYYLILILYIILIILVITAHENKRKV